MKLEPLNIEVGRRNPAAGGHVQLGRPNFFLRTVTTEDRKPWLTNPVAHRWLCESWLAATAWLVGDFLLMPDHLYAFCAPRDLTFTIERWITFWKRDFRRRHGRDEWRFQTLGWHLRSRQDEGDSAKRLYVQKNPVRNGLAQNLKDWPYKGTIHPLTW